VQNGAAGVAVGVWEYYWDGFADGPWIRNIYSLCANAVVDDAEFDPSVNGWWDPFFEEFREGCAGQSPQIVFGGQ
jgi:hypothetical protein